MKNKLLLAGFLISIYTFLLLTAFFYQFGDSTVVPVERNAIFSNVLVNVILIAAIVILPAHAYLAWLAFKKHDMDISRVIPYYAIPYMLGVIAHTMIQ